MLNYTNIAMYIQNLLPMAAWTWGAIVATKITKSCLALHYIIVSRLSREWCGFLFVMALECCIIFTSQESYDFNIFLFSLGFQNNTICM